MEKRMLRIFLLPVLVLFLASVTNAQTQAGSIKGTITDEEGTPLPGVTVTISSPALMGVRSFVTGEGGVYRFPVCPPGRYVVRAELQGFQTMERPDIVISVGSTVSIDFSMQAAKLEEEITVTAPSPVIDTKSAKITSLITSDLKENIPIGRDIFDLVKTAPSVVAEEVSYRKMISIHGSTLQQSTYALDGVDLTDPYRGYISKGVAFDAIEEVEMILGGHGAEVGRTSAGYINVVTKSGGNTLSGSLTTMYTAKSLFQSTIPESQIDALNLSPPIFDQYNYDLSMTLGGPIIKDRLWFFVNPQFLKWERTTNFIPFTDATGEFHDAFNVKHKDIGFFGKLTAQITNNLKYMGMYQFLDMREDPCTIWLLPTRAYEVSQYWIDYSHTISNVFNYVLDQNTFVDLKVGYVFRKMELQDFYERGTWDLIPFAYDRYYGTAWGMHWVSEWYDRKKLDADLNFTRYQDNFLGADHEIKAGVSYTWWKTGTSFYSKYPYETYWYRGTPWYYHDIVPYLGAFYLTNAGPDIDTSIMWDQSYRLGFFVQDTISIGKKLTINVGLRYDSAHMTRPEETRQGWVDTNNNGLANILLPNVFSTEDQTAPEIKDLIVWNKLQPRIGITYDPFGDGSTALKFSFSRYAEKFIANMTGGLHPFDPWRLGVWTIWWDNDHDGVRDLPPVDDYFATSEPRVTTDPSQLSQWIDPNMTSPYVDEITAGIQRELVRDFSLGVSFVYRENKNITELLDTANPIGGDMWLPYTVNDPGGDAEFGTSDDQQLTVFALRRDAQSPNLYRTNIPELKRKYWGIEFIAFKRMSNNWQFSGSVVYSKQYGNIGAGYWDSEGDEQFYTNPNRLINNWGRLNWDRPLIVKLMGTVILPYRILFSAYFRHYTGSPDRGQSGYSPLVRTLTVYFPSTVNGVEVKYPSVTVMAEPPGSKRYPNEDILDLRLEKDFALGPGRLGVYMDVFNVLGQNRIIADVNNGGYIYADGSYEQRPLYGNILAAEGVRSFRFTLRYKF